MIEIKNMKIFIQVMLGLYDLHKIKSVHREIRSENILFMDEETVKIICLESMDNLQSSRSNKKILKISPLKFDMYSMGILAFMMFKKGDK
jgi:serine/threonine protein kinase